MEADVKGYFGWQTALVVGITLLTAYGKEIGQFIKNLFTGKERIDAMAFSQKQLNKAMTEGAVEAAEESTRLDILYNATTDTTRATNERKQAVEELQRLYPAYFANLDSESIMLGKAKSQYDSLKKAILETARAKAAENIITENSEQLLRIEESFEYGQIGALLDMRKKYDDIVKGGVGESYEYFYIFKDAERNIKQINREIDIFGKKIAKNLNLPAEAKNDILGYVEGLKASNIELSKAIDVRDLIGKQSEPLDSSSVSSSLSERRQAEIDLLKTQAQEEAGIQERIYQDEQLHYDKRLEAFEKFREVQEKLLSLQYGADREELDVRLAAGK